MVKSSFMVWWGSGVALIKDWTPWRPFQLVTSWGHHQQVFFQKVNDNLPFH
jgi:hypothetical protein